MSDKAHNPVELRSANLTQVGYEERVIELIAAPYDQWAPVEVAGRLVEESFAPGAFDGVEHRLGDSRFLVNLDHDPGRLVGWIDELDPTDERGLRANLKIRRGVSDEGVHMDQVLDDAADGFYCASVGFAPFTRGGEEWSEQRSRRRIVRAFLDHIALTPQPAYVGAGVLAVRTAPPKSATPNLDRILAERRAQAYGDP